MTDNSSHKNDSGRRKSGSWESEFHADLGALRQESGRDLPSKVETSRVLSRALQREEEGGFWMRLHRNGSEKGRWIGLAGAAAVAAILLFVPISFDKTVGHEVHAELMAGPAGAEELGWAADQAGTAFESGRIMVRAGQDASLNLSVRVQERIRERVVSRVAQFATDLAEHGIAADFTITPVRERITANIYAAAANSLRTIRVDTEGRSAEEIAADLRAQLADAGLDDAQINVSMEGNCKRICVRAEGAEGHDLPNIECGDGGAPEGCALLKIERTEEMSDTDVIAEIERQLASQGLSGTVTLDADGCPKIEMSEGCD